MLTTVLLIYLVSSVTADDGYTETEIVPRCSDTPGTRMTFSAVDGYVGRYIAELCTERNTNLEEWSLHLTFYETPDYCNASNPKKDLEYGTTHSKNVEWVSSEHNCSSNQTVCMSATFDLIFSACYCMSSRFPGKAALPLQYFYFNVTNNHTKKEFANNRAHVYQTDYKDHISLTWYTGVPPMIYEILLCNDSQSNWDLCPKLSNCSITDKTTIECSLNPPYGCYDAYLKHIAPWIQGEFYSQQNAYHHFCYNETISVVVSGSVWDQWVWLVVGLCLVLLLVGLAVRYVCRSIDLRKRQQKALWKWLTHRNGAPPPAVQRPRCRDVLLLYARECSQATKAVAALKTALQYVVDGEVLDIFDPCVMAECASCPYAWISRALQRRDTAVLLLQAPALHYHYHYHCTGERDKPVLSEVAGRRVVGAGRTPQFGDALLQYALRLTTETLLPTHTHNYNKYYIATISDLPTEILPCVVPYRRYELPGALHLLLRDISSQNRDLPPAEIMDNFSILLKEFIDYAKDNPDYLMEELMVVDT